MAAVLYRIAPVMLRSVRTCWSATGFALLVMLLGSDLLAKPIRLRSGTLDPGASRRGSAAVPGNRESLYLVQFRAPLDGLGHSALKSIGVELLRSIPEDRNARDEEGATPLHQAAWEGDLELVRQLLAAGADPTITDLRFGSTPLGWAEHAYQTEAADLLRPHTPTEPAGFTPHS